MIIIVADLRGSYRYSVIIEGGVEKLIMKYFSTLDLNVGKKN
jgi:hypothetical protein